MTVILFDILIISEWDVEDIPVALQRYCFFKQVEDLHGRASVRPFITVKELDFIQTFLECHIKFHWLKYVTHNTMVSGWSYPCCSTRC